MAQQDGRRQHTSTRPDAGADAAAEGRSGADADLDAGIDLDAETHAETHLDAGTDAGTDGTDGTDADEMLDREAEEVTLAVMAASRLIVALSARALGSVDVPLTLPQLRSLVALRTCGPIKLAAMAATLGVSPSTALRMVERLESFGLTDRRVNPDNRREVVLRLTPAGEDLVDRVLRHRRAGIRTLVTHLPARERAGLVPALRALTSVAGVLDPHLAPSADVDRLAGVLDDPLNPAP